MRNQNMDVLIIGAGQAGLAVGYWLKNANLTFQIVDGNNRIGDNWRDKYDSLILFTPRAYSSLPGLPLSGDLFGYPSKDEFADYLETYARHFELPISLATEIRELECMHGGFRATTQTGAQILCRAVVMATGAFQKPSIPSISKGFSQEVLQLPAKQYKNPSQIPPGTLLVVGDGASGRDIASELAITHQVILATGRPRKLLPEWILGKHIFWWLDKLGILNAPGDSLLGRYVMKTDSFPGRGKDFKRLRQKGVQIMPSLKQATGRKAVFAGGATAEVDAIVWATGYRDNSQWVSIPAVIDEHGQFIQWQGISPIRGLYFIGRPWQRSRGSAFIAGVGADADFITAKILEDFEQRETIVGKTLPPIGQMTYR